MGFADHGVAPEIVERNQPFIARTGLGWAVFQAHFIDQNGGGGMGGTWAWLPSPSGHRLPSSVPWNVFSFFFHGCSQCCGHDHYPRGHQQTAHRKMKTVCGWSSWDTRFLGQKAVGQIKHLGAKKCPRDHASREACASACRKLSPCIVSVRLCLPGDAMRL